MTTLKNIQDLKIVLPKWGWNKKKAYTAEAGRHCIVDQLPEIQFQEEDLFVGAAYSSDLHHEYKGIVQTKHQFANKAQLIEEN